MTGGERYLEQQAKRARKEYLETPHLRQAPLQIERLVLRDASATFQDRLRRILQQGGDGGGERGQPMISSLVVESVEEMGLEAKQVPCMGGGQAATIIGSAQQGKTSMLNSLLSLFGFLHPEVVFPQVDLLPTNSKDAVGLPFPLRLEYGPKYELLLQRWDGQRLQELMCKVAESKLAQNADFFSDLEEGFLSVDKGSCLELVAKYGSVDENNVYSPSSCVVESLLADGRIEVHDFLYPEQPSRLNPSLEVYEAVHEFLMQLVEDARWLHYERVTLKCPSQLLKYLNTGSQSELGMCILDLPAVGLSDDNNALVEELVLRDTSSAGNVIILTGVRSFTQDLIHVLRSTIFERLLDPLVVPRPTVAITNSRNLRGLKEADMASWRETTLHGNLGWNTEVQAFADEMFSGRRHRELQSLEPDLFPNDLEAFMATKEGAQEKGISMLVGYILRLPQEVLLASVADVLECTRSIMMMVDQLWQAKKVSWKGLKSCRLLKEAKELREQEFARDMDAELSPSMQKEIFGFEAGSGGSRTYESHTKYIQDLFHEQNLKLAERFENIKASKGDVKQDICKMVKDHLLHIASQWDEQVGYPAYERFLMRGEEISKRLYRQWAAKLFLGAGRNCPQDKNRDHACQFMIAYLNSTATAAIKQDAFKYTLTHGLRLQAWNLDLKDVAKGLGARRGRSTPAAFHQLWSSLVDVMRSKEAYFKGHVLEHLTLQSSSIKQLVRLLKQLVLQTFAHCESNFLAVMDALERIATGKLAISEDPVVVLREEIGQLVKDIERYLSRHKEMRNSFGGQELEKVIRRL